jgi:hypothetical protein
MSWSLVRAVLVMGMAVMVAACGARTEYAVEEVRVDRPAWDSLIVDVTFVQRTLLGRSRRLDPDSTMIVAYSTDSDTLLAGPGPSFSFPDLALGDREGVLLDVCGAIRNRWICDQMGIRASPKRITVDADIDFPIEPSFTRGRYAVATVIEREALNGGEVERIPYRGQTVMMIEAFVPNAEEARVRMPIRGSSGDFNLAAHAGYDDFRFFLDSHLMDHGEAPVQFVVFAGLDAPSEAVAHLTRTVSPITHEDRLANVNGFVRQAARILVDDLSAFLGGRRMAAYLHGWHYNAMEERYEIEMEVRWRGSFFDQRDFTLIGVLRVGETGEDAVFSLSEGNRPALDRWERRIRSNQRRIGQLQVERPVERYRPGARN